MDNRQPLQTGTIVGGDYRIEKVLGAGGFGITYLARDEKLDAKVALKEYFPASLAYREDGATIQPMQSQGGADYAWGLERFLAEAQTLARLRHPNIVRVSRYFKENETAYMVLGFVEGEDYEAWLRKLARAPSQDELDALVGPVLDALETVHAADLVHRDIKPQNIFIRSEDHQPIILDFGAARQALGEHSRATAAFVSPGYSPSESHLNDPSEQGPWTDIYSFAATLYRALVGRSPAQVLSRVSRDSYVPLGQQLPNPEDYRAPFLAAIDEALSVRREDRPQSVADWRKKLFADPNDVPTVVSVPEKTKVISSGEKTVVNEAPTRVSAEEATATRIESRARGRGPHSGPASQGSKLQRWALAAGGIAIAVIGLTNIYRSFETSQPSPGVQPTPAIQPAPQPSTQPNVQPAPQQPAQQPASAPQPLEEMGTPPPAQQSTADTLFARDPSLRRLATASWHSSGLQNGFWTAVTSGSNGTGFYLRCRGNDGVRRESNVELEFIPTGNQPLVGNQEVQAQIGSYSTNAILNFTSANGFSQGSVTVSETEQDAGQFLNFLHQAFLGNQLVLTIPAINYQETFNLNGAEEALNVCFGADVAQPWRSYVPVNNVAGGEVRNADGSVLLVRCDKTPETRGNTVIAFSTPFNGNVAPNLYDVTVNIGGNSFNGSFQLASKGDALGGVLYHVVSDANTRQQVNQFLELMRRNNQITLSSSNPAFNQSFSLSGSRAVLSACDGL